MTAWFEWFDAHPGVHLVAGWLPLVLLAAELGWQSRRPDHGGDGLNVTLLALALLGWRWPELLGIHAVGVAEPEIVAGGLATRIDWLPYRAAATGFAGPLTLWLQFPTHWLGVPLDTFNARFAALLLDGIALAGGYTALRFAARPLTAALAMLPALALLANGHDPGVFQYSATHATLAVAAWTVVALLAARGAMTSDHCGERKWAISAGLGVALLPWCGAGAIPWACVLGGTGVWWLTRIAGVAATRRRDAVKWFGIASVYLMLLGVCWINGLGEFSTWRSIYFSTGLAPGPDLQASTHRLTLAFVATAAIAALLRGLSTPIGQRRTLVGAGVLGFMLLLGQSFGEPPAIFGSFADYWRHPRSALGTTLKRFSQPNDTVAVWGNDAALLAETELAPATRPATSRLFVGFAAIDGDEDPLDRYLSDLTERRPVFFVDLGDFDHTTVPALATRIEDDFLLVRTTNGRRLYARRDIVRARGIPVGNILPLSLEAATLTEAAVPMAYVDSPDGGRRIFAHAPSDLAHPIPPGAAKLRGRFGFQPDVELQTKTPTTGAVFAVELVQPDGSMERRFEQLLRPFENEADRVTHEFEVDLTGNAATSVLLRIFEYGNNSADWTFWEDLRFETE